MIFANYPHLDPSLLNRTVESTEDDKEKFAGKRNQPLKYTRAVTVALRANHGREGQKKKGCDQE